jgi:hypothetical protein
MPSTISSDSFDDTGWRLVRHEVLGIEHSIHLSRL